MFNSLLDLCLITEILNVKKEHICFFSIFKSILPLRKWQKSLREQDYKINMNVIVKCYQLNKFNNSERNVLIEYLLIQLFYLLIHVEVFNNIRLT